MDQFPKEPKRGTIQSFFSSHSVKNRKSTSSISHNVTNSRPDETFEIGSTSASREQQEEQISSYSSSLSRRLLQGGKAHPGSCGSYSS